MAKVIMVQGTMSNVGKSLVVAGLCRIFKQDGYNVAPFKSQNMALNSFITKDGFEMGRAQVMQAEACEIEPDIRMNPILLKPTTDTGSQVIVNGKVIAQMKAMEYFKNKKNLIPEILNSFNSLSEEFDIIVIEGAGSPAEINLKSEDIVNMGMAKMANSPVVLVGDIDRGGVFASLFGTIKLLETDEQEKIMGVIINKFRGDLKLLYDGITMLENLIEKPVLGVIPFINVDIDDEDSLCLEDKNLEFDEKKEVNLINIAVINLPKISNFTDFNSLNRHEFVSVKYVKNVKELGKPDLIIVPGTKNTISDLLWLRQNGLEAKIKKLVSENTPVIGICGGYQMLGNTIKDPENIENGGEIRGMEFLNIDTVFESEKLRTRVSGEIKEIFGYFSDLSHSTFEGYEIHMGKTVVHENNLSELNNGVLDGSYNENVFGSYVHGIFDNGTLYDDLIKILLKNKDINKEFNEYKFNDINNIKAVDYKKYKEIQYNLLADEIRHNLNIKKIYEIMEIERAWGND